MLITLYKISEVHFCLLGTNGFHVKAKNERFTAASSRCRQNLKYENFTSSFARLRQDIASQSVPHVQHDYFSSFKQSNHWFEMLSLPLSNLKLPIKQTWRRRQREPHKFAYLTSEWKTALLHALHVHFFFFLHFAVVPVLSTTWNDQFCRFVDTVSTWRQIFMLIFLSLRRWFRFNSRILRTKFANMVIGNNDEMIAQTRSYILRWSSRCRLLCGLSSLLSVLTVICNSEPH